jgi:hypothetical protein
LHHKRQGFDHFGVLMDKKHIFSRLLKKAISMALWTKASLCVKSSLLEQSLPRTPSRPKTSMISVNPVILSNFFSCPNVFVAKTLCACPPRRLAGNPWFINDLRPCKALYNCRDTFTDVMSPLQIKLFMQNKAKFRKVKLNVNNVLTKDYEQKDTWSSGKKQSQTNPNKAKSKKAKMNVTSYMTKGYGNIPPIRAPKKQSQTSKRQKPMQPSLPKRIMKNTTLSASGKTNPTCRGIASGKAGNEPN